MLKTAHRNLFESLQGPFDNAVCVNFRIFAADLGSLLQLELRQLEGAILATPRNRESGDPTRSGQ
jgi:hypothetical protein